MGINDPVLLDRKIEEALKELYICRLKDYDFRETITSRNRNLEKFDQLTTSLKKEILSELLYALVENKYPDDAEKLVGTFLEMDRCEILKLISDPDYLDEKSTKVLSV